MRTDRETDTELLYIGLINSLYDKHNSQLYWYDNVVNIRGCLYTEWCGFKAFTAPNQESSTITIVLLDHHTSISMDCVDMH